MQYQDNLTQQNVSDEITLKELFLKFREWWLYLLSKWVIIITAGIIGGIFGLIYAKYKKPSYKAEFTFVLEVGKQGPELGYAGLASQFGIGMATGGGSGVFTGNNLLPLMKSRFIIEQTLLRTININGKKQTLAEFYIEIKDLREKWSKTPLESVKFLPNSDPGNFSLEQNSIINELHATLIKDNLFIGNKIGETSILVLRVTSENELFSKYFAEALEEEVSDFYTETKIKKSSTNLAHLEHQADSVRNALYLAFKSVASFSDAIPHLNSTRQVIRVPSQQRQIDIQANQTMLLELIKNIETTKMSLREEMPIIQIIDRPVLPLPVERANLIKEILLWGFGISFLCLILLVCRRAISSILNWKQG